MFGRHEEQKVVDGLVDRRLPGEAPLRGRGQRHVRELAQDRVFPARDGRFDDGPLRRGQRADVADVDVVGRHRGRGEAQKVSQVVSTT